MKFVTSKINNLIGALKRDERASHLQQYFESRTGVQCPIIDKNSVAPKAPFIVRYVNRKDLRIEGQDVIKCYNQGIDKVRVLVVMAVYNEADILGQVVEHCMQQDVDLYILDNHSGDDTPTIIKLLKQKYRGRIFSESFPKNPPKNHLLDRAALNRRQDEISSQSNYDWIIQCDADEIRTAPNPSMTLAEYITMVDQSGYNAIDFTVINFWPTADGFDGSQKLDEFFKYFDFGLRPGHFRQVKGWKNQHKLAGFDKDGGHGIAFEGMKVYPLKFLLKHYSIRSSEQARRKLYNDRKPVEEALAKGWHGHYDILRKQENHIRDPHDLIRYNSNFYTQYNIERLTGIGLTIET